MNILLTGVTGYVGKRLLPVLLEQGHVVYCCVRNKNRFPEHFRADSNVHIIEVDFLDNPAKEILPENIDIAYYLIHSMSSGIDDFSIAEARAAENFVHYLGKTRVRQLIYLGGIANAEKLSKHLESRKNVEAILSRGKYHTTVLRAGIIIGSGSASFEIIRDLVEKLPVMITPKWVLTKSQPIAIQNVLEYLTGVMDLKDTYDKSFDIGGPDVLTYKEMLQQFAEVRGFRRFILNVPVMTPRLSSYWLYFITPGTYNLSVNLVNSMKVDIIGRNNDLARLLDIEPISYREAIQRAFQVIKQHAIVSSWKDAINNKEWSKKLSSMIDMPTHGCFRDTRILPLKTGTEVDVLERIWSLGGNNGWYYATWLWKLRGFIDRLAGGVGLRRGRTNRDSIQHGDSLDFWRVLFAGKEEQRLLLFAEMKVPGEAWLEFRIKEENGIPILIQTATFRARGVPGRLYWYSMLPLHFFIFRGMIRKIAAV